MSGKHYVYEPCNYTSARAFKISFDKYNTHHDVVSYKSVLCERYCGITIDNNFCATGLRSRSHGNLIMDKEEP